MGKKADKITKKKGKLFEKLHEIRRLDSAGIIDALTSVREQAKIFRKMGFKV